MAQTSVSSPVATWMTGLWCSLQRGRASLAMRRGAKTFTAAAQRDSSRISLLGPKLCSHNWTHRLRQPTSTASCMAGTIRILMSSQCLNCSPFNVAFGTAPTSGSSHSMWLWNSLPALASPNGSSWILPRRGASARLWAWRLPPLSSRVHCLSAWISARSSKPRSPRAGAFPASQTQARAIPTTPRASWCALPGSPRAATAHRRSAVGSSSARPPPSARSATRTTAGARARQAALDARSRSSERTWRG
mmetsp:Transcript_77624/g.231295  ORF Transcript_77624/g.231295 Transcript_77624/m.231295 type:complete len:248 (+) Transcript_77624:164-907(+)